MLTQEDKIFLTGISNPSVTRLITSLKSKNLCVCDVKWQGERIAHKLSNEHCKHIHAYDPRDAPNGYLMGSCDPFLVLLAHILKVNIRFNFAGNTINYTTSDAKRVLNFSSSKTHFN